VPGDIETYFENGEWRNWDQDAQVDVGEPHPNRDEAVAEGQELARGRNVEHVVRDQDATIVARDEYGDDEHPTDALREQQRAGFESRYGTPEPVAERDRG
jgi:Uncharacterized protein conserved in bacteria (DUF2188)